MSLAGSPESSSTSSTLVRSGLVLEYKFDECKNLLKYSQQINGVTDWSKTNTTASNNTTTAPDGTNTGCKFIETSDTNQQHRISQAVTLATNTTYTYSVYAMAAERDIIRVYVLNKAGSYIGTYFNLTTGAKGTSSAGATGYIVSVGEGWYRCSVSFTSGAGASAPAVYALVSTADNTPSYNGDGSSGVYVWGFQLEGGTDARTYVSTTSKQTLTESIGGYTGTLGANTSAGADDPPWCIEGASFATNDYIVCGNIATPLRSISVAFYNNTELSAAMTTETLINLADTDTSITFGPYSDNLTNEIITIGDGTNASAWCHESDTLAVGWHLLDVIWTTDQYNIYIDGTLKTTSKSGTPEIITSNNFEIGRLGSGANFFGGSVAYITGYSKSIIDSEQSQNQSVYENILEGARGVINPFV
jgi:hypothetical protein